MAKAADAADSTERAEQSERALGRGVAYGLPVLTSAAAIVVFMMTTIGPAVLVLAAGVLLGTIALFWASVRTLSGDAPLPVDLEALAARRHGVDSLAEHKNMLLRALKDLENEHTIGKIDDKDFAEVASEYRDEVKSVMRAMDAEVLPMRARAEELARGYLKKRGVDGDVAGPPPADPGAESGGAEAADDEPKAHKVDRLACVKCGTSNEPDAAFCKKCGTAVQPAEADSHHAPA